MYRRGNSIVERKMSKEWYINELSTHQERHEYQTDSGPEEDGA